MANIIQYDLFNSRPLRQPKRGKTLVLLGTAKDGPANQPMLINHPSLAEEMFGSEDTGTLVKGFKQAYQTAPSTDIFMMRVTGEYAEYEVWGYRPDGNLDKTMIIRSKYAGEIYNQMRVTFVLRPKPESDVNEPCMYFEFPEERNMLPVAYYLQDYTDLAKLAQSINEDTNKGDNLAYITCLYNNEDTLSIFGPNAGSHSLEGGEDGTAVTKNALYLALDYSYKLLEGFYADIILPLGVYIDDVHPVALFGTAYWGNSYYASGDDYLSLTDTETNSVCTFHGQLISYCKKQMGFGAMSHGVIGFKPVNDISDITAYEYSYIMRLAEATAFQSRYGLKAFQGGEWLDLGHFISVVATEVCFNEGTPDEYFDNGAAVYAALLTDLGPLATTTNKQVPGIETLRYEFTSDELSALAKLGVVSFRYSVYQDCIVVSNGVTASLESSELHSIANVRQVQLVLAELNDIVQDMLGEAYQPSVFKLQAEQRIKNKLDSLKGSVLQDYDFSVYFSNGGSGFIAVNLLPLHAVEFISGQASVNVTAR